MEQLKALLEQIPPPQRPGEGRNALLRRRPLGIFTQDIKSIVEEIVEEIVGDEVILEAVEFFDVERNVREVRWVVKCDGVML